MRFDSRQLDKGNHNIPFLLTLPICSFQQYDEEILPTRFKHIIVKIPGEPIRLKQNDDHFCCVMNREVPCNAELHGDVDIEGMVTWYCEKHPDAVQTNVNMIALEIKDKGKVIQFFSMSPSTKFRQVEI